MAIIFVVPAFIPVTSPSLFTLAISASSEFHTIILLSALSGNTLALSVKYSPTLIVAALLSRVIEEGKITFLTDITLFTSSASSWFISPLW